MAQDRRKALDDKTRKLGGAKIEEGKEHAAYQETQQQLLAIQAEQQQNLAVARAESKASFENNQTLAQAAELGAISAAEAEQMAQAGGQVTLNPATQSVLSKYGVGQPKFSRTQSHSQQVTKQNITINNNVTSNTTNDVKVPAGVGGPLQGRPLQFKDPQTAGQSSVNKFKVWISQAFARQNEEGVKRDREYRNRENSLTKSASRMMKKLEDVGKTIGTRMDPRKIGSTWQSQLKTLLLLFGFGYLTSNWTKVLDTVAGIEDWVKKTWSYFTGEGGENKKSFISDIKSFLGGKKEESLFDTFKELIIGDDGFFGRFKDYLKNVRDDRKSAISMVKFPEINFDDMIGTIKSVGSYIGSLLTAIVSGTEGTQSIITDQIKSISNKGAYEQASKDEATRKSISHNTTSGKLIEADKGIEALIEGKYQGLTRYSIDDNGNLTNDAFGAEATVAQAGDISRLFNMANKGDGIKSTELAAGLQRLFNSAKVSSQNGNGIPVTAGFIRNWFDDEELRGLQTSKDLRKVNYYAVARKKTDADYAIENADPMTRAIKAGTNQYLLNNTPVVGDFAKRTKITEGAIAGAGMGTLFGMPFVGAAVGGAVGWAASTPEYQAISEYLKGTINKATANEYRVEYVRQPRPGDEIITDPNTGEPARIPLWEISDKTVQKIADKITGKENVNIDINDENFVTSVHSELQKSAINSLSNDIDVREKYRKTHPTNYENNRELINTRQKLNDVKYNQGMIDYDIRQAYEQRDKFNKERAAREAEYKKKHSNDRVAKLSNNAKDKVNQATDYISETFGLQKVSASNISKAPLSQKEYVGKMRPLLVRTLKSKSFVPKDKVETYADILTAQSSLESNWGNSELSKKYNNYSGMTKGTAKYHGVSSVSMTNSKGQDRNTYAVFNSVEDWADDYVEYLNRKWNAFSGDSSQYFNKLQHNGTGQSYATAPNYVSSNLSRLGRIKSIADSKETLSFENEPIQSSNIIAQNSESTPKKEDQSEDNIEPKGNPKTFLQILKDKVSEYITGFGGMLSSANDKIEEAVSPITNEAKRLVLKDGKKYGGPITGEFLTYEDYLRNQNDLPDGLPKGLSEADWRNRVYDMTGSMPQNLKPREGKILSKYTKEGENTKVETKSVEVSQAEAPIKNIEKSSPDLLSLIDPENMKKQDDIIKDIRYTVEGCYDILERNLSANIANGMATSTVVDAVNQGTMASANASRNISRSIQIQQKNTVANAGSLEYSNDSYKDLV
jgi:flagellum-specific peptidoglycan hydrolase FlgJ